MWAITKPGYLPHYAEEQEGNPAAVPLDPVDPKLVGGLRVKLIHRDHQNNKERGNKNDRPFLISSFAVSFSLPFFLAEKEP